VIDAANQRDASIAVAERAVKNFDSGERGRVHEARAALPRPRSRRVDGLGRAQCRHRDADPGRGGDRRRRSAGDRCAAARDMGGLMLSAADVANVRPILMTLLPNIAGLVLAFGVALAQGRSTG